MARCAKIINVFETHVARAYFGALRMRDDFPSRNKAERPDLLPVTVFINEKEHTFDLPAELRPIAVSVPVWDDISILSVHHDGNLEPVISWRTFKWVPENFETVIGANQGDSIRVPLQATLNAAKFLRFLAKVAYCHAIVYHGVKSFVDYTAIRHVILGDATNAPYYIGVAELSGPPSQTIHDVFLEWFVPPGTTTIEYIIVRIRFLACYSQGDTGMPAYYVVTGFKLINSEAAAITERSSLNKQLTQHQ